MWHASPLCRCGRGWTKLGLHEAALDQERAQREEAEAPAQGVPLLEAAQSAELVHHDTHHDRARLCPLSATESVPASAAAPGLGGASEALPRGMPAVHSNGARGHRPERLLDLVAIEQGLDARRSPAVALVALVPGPARAPRLRDDLDVELLPLVPAVGTVELSGALAPRIRIGGRGRDVLRQREREPSRWCKASRTRPRTRIWWKQRRSSTYTADRATTPGETPHEEEPADL